MLPLHLQRQHDELIKWRKLDSEQLPAGARRLVQKSDGIKATVVNGRVVLRDSEPTGALPGSLLRGPLAG